MTTSIESNGRTVTTPEHPSEMVPIVRIAGADYVPLSAIGNATIGKPHQTNRWGVLKVNPPADFKPTSPMKTPAVVVPHCIDGELLCEFAARVNESQFAIDRKEWLFVTSAQTLVQVHMNPEIRPTDGREWPVFVEPVGNFEDAERIVIGRNEAILATARVPKIWWVLAKQANFEKR
jgi:hypothetical protein